MPIASYRIWGWGGGVNGGKGDAINIAVAGIAKPATPGHPLEIVNEIVCGDLGRALRLPIPPGVVVHRDSDKKPFHVSLNFSESGQQLPPGDATLIARQNPELSCGVILFDLWIANYDRIEKNLAYDDVKKTLQLFDHGRALFCGTQGRQHLTAINEKALIDSNCLSAEIERLDGFGVWDDRIRKLPETFIREAFSDAIGIGLDKSDATFGADFLIERRKRLWRIVKKNKAIFHNVKPSMFPLKRRQKP